MSDKVFINGLRAETVIGVYDWERKIRQPLIFDLEMATDNRAGVCFAPNRKRQLPSQHEAR